MRQTQLLICPRMGNRFKCFFKSYLNKKRNGFYLTRLKREKRNYVLMSF